jgi:hypothetical protein
LKTPIFVKKNEMNRQMSVADILKNVADWGLQDVENLYEKLYALRLQKRSAIVLNKALNKAETKLLTQINKPFPIEKWERLKYLDWKLEFNALSETEEAESLKLAEAYENYYVERTKAISQLAALRQTTVDELAAEIGIKTLSNG